MLFFRAEFEVEREELSLRIESLKEQHEDHVMKLRSAISLLRTRYSELTEQVRNQTNRSTTLIFWRERVFTALEILYMFTDMLIKALNLKT